MIRNIFTINTCGVSDKIDIAKEFQELTTININKLNEGWVDYGETITLNKAISFLN